MKDKIVEKIAKSIEIFVNSIKLKSIQFIISFSFILITILAMLFVGIAIYNKVSILSEQNAIINTRQIIDQVNTNLDYYMRSMIEISDYLDNIIYYDNDIQNDKLREQMNVIVSSRKDIVTLAIFSDNGDLILSVPSNKIKSSANIKQQDWFTTPLREMGNLYFSSPHVQNIFEGQHKWVVSLSRKVIINRNGKRIPGVLLVDMNFSVIDQICTKVAFGKKGYIYIIDSKGNIVYHPQLPLINVGLKRENIKEVQEHVFGKFFDKVNGERRLITIETVNFCRWRIVGIAYMDEISTIKKDMSLYILWVLLIGILFFISISAFISAKISRPIKQLEKSMMLVEKGQFDVNIDVKGEAEVAQLSRTFNIMVSRIKQLMNQIVEEQESKRISELNALQAQINPHFLYNTLDSVVWMAENGKSDDVISMVTALARLFRISISKGKNIISVSEEIEHARNYLVIQSIRYRNKFEYEFDVQEEALKYKTLKLVLQPIIENAIYHGIEYMVDKGKIKISVSVTNGKLLFEVRDNGVGIEEEVLNNLLSYESSKKKGSGVGVKNVHERIRLYFGKEYGLKIESELDVGTNVQIWLPLIEEEKLEAKQNEIQR
ncbi:sensor histidine kinase [Caloramator sp. E03]|uniref:sensor histidine kinase n=1 Tax=Caloramator sp. E03 TaxID=2576307 RepID=UPI001FA9DD07|nr:sensor histidine kinase [Caloramator sp. E03]